MLFTTEQIDELLSIVDYHNRFLIVNVLGKDALTPYDKLLLKENGIDVDKLTRENPSYYQMYLFGKLSSELSNSQAGQVDYDNFKKYVKRGQYIPLNKAETARYELARKRSYNHLKGMSDKQKEFITNTISEEMVKGVEDRRSAQKIMSEIAHKTGDWQRDWGRIVETEYNDIFQQGRAEGIKAKGSEESLVYKEVYPKACRHCIRLYLTGGIGSKPKVFTVEELEANGVNYGKKVSDWKPTISSTHAHCRCNLFHIPKGYVWDEEKGRFTIPKDYQTKRKVKAVLNVGDKEFLV